MLLVVPHLHDHMVNQVLNHMSASFKGSSSVFTIMEDLSQVRTTCTQQQPLPLRLDPNNASSTAAGPNNKVNGSAKSK